MKKLILTALLAASSGAYAGPPGPIGHLISSPVESVRINNEGLATVYFTYAIYGDMFTTGCRHDEMNHAFGFDANTDVGKIFLSVLLEAKASGLRVTAYGTGRCMGVEGSLVEVLQFARVS
jgi:hypothetical protein